MDQVALVVLIAAAIVGILAVIVILRRGRPKESPFASSTEGEKICPNCGMGNMWTDRTCISCGGPLRG